MLMFTLVTTGCVTFGSNDCSQAITASFNLSFTDKYPKNIYFFTALHIQHHILFSPSASSPWLSVVSGGVCNCGAGFFGVYCSF